MSRAKLKGSTTVTRGHQTLRISPWTDAKTSTRRWRFSVAQPDGKRRWITRSTKDEACAAAEKWLETAPEDLAFSLLPDSRRRWLEEIHRQVSATDEARVLEFIAALKRSGDITEAVENFCAGQVSKKGELTPHQRQVNAVLKALAKSFAGKTVADIHLPDLQDWWEKRNDRLGWKRKRDTRAMLVQFWLWCRKQKLVPSDADTVAHCLPEVATKHGSREVIEHFATLQALVHAVSPEFRAWLVLGCFAGLRPEEIAPGAIKKEAKRGINREEIDWDFKVIRISAEVSKVGIPRIIPMNDACRLGLQWAGIKPGDTGPVSPENAASEGETKRLGELVFKTGWPADVLRHSYGSYRNAVIRNLDQVAEEMGSSITMMKRHYHNPRAEKEGKVWFRRGAALFRLLLSPLKSKVKPTEIEDAKISHSA